MWSMNGSEARILNLLGLAMRAGKVVTGEEAVLHRIRAGKVALVILASDASENTKKKFRDKCRFYQVRFIIAFDRYRLGQAIGKAERVVVGVVDEGFAKLIGKSMGNGTEVIE